MGNPTFNFVRIIPRDSEFLNRKLGSRGEIFYDRDSNTLRLFDGSTTGGTLLAKADLTNVTNANFLAKATAAGVSGGSSVNTFSTVAVSGQSDIVADSSSDILTFVAGTNITITTNATNDSITINSTAAGGSNPSFSTISIPGQTDIEAITASDTVFLNGEGIDFRTNGKNLTLINTWNFSIAGDDSTLRVINNNNSIKFIGSGSVTTSTDADGNVTITGATASTTFSTLTDASSAGLTIDEVYLPAITMLQVTNSGASAYLFDQYTGNNPTLYAISGTTIAFKLAATGHPFLIQDGAGTNYNTGLVHVSTSGAVTTGSDAQGKDSGTLYWKIPIGISGGYRYQCGAHGAMVGSISIKNFVSI